MQVDAVEQRAGEFSAITRNLLGRAPALTACAAQMPAGTRVHCRDQLELGGKFGLPSGARNVNAAVFQRLTQRFEHAAIELRQFVQKQHAVMRQ